MSSKHSINDLPDSPAKRTATTKSILERNAKLTDEELSGMHSRAQRENHIFILCTKPLVELIFFETDSENDAYHHNINAAVREGNNTLLLGSYSLISVGNLIQNFGYAPVHAYRASIRNTIAKPPAKKEGGPVHYVRQVLLRSVNKRSTPTTRKRIVEKIAEWMNHQNVLHPPKLHDSDKTWTPPPFTVTANFDRTPEDLLPLDYYVQPESIFQYLKITNEEHYNTSFYTQNQVLAGMYFSPPYPEQAKMLLGYPVDTAKVERANIPTDQTADAAWIDPEDLERDDDQEEEESQISLLAVFS